MRLERDTVIKKMFDAALKEKINQLARKYDHTHVIELWTRLTKEGCVKAYFCKWRWNQSMTIKEALDCLDDYFTGLESLLRRHEAVGKTGRPRITGQKNTPIPNLLPKARPTNES